MAVGIQHINEITTPDLKTVITKDLNCIPIQMNLKYMQYLNHKRSNQLGLSAIIRYVDQTPIKYDDTSLGRLSAAIIPSIGITYKMSFLPKKSIIPEYWMSFQAGLNYFNYNKSFAGLDQTLMVHLSDRMQWGFRLEQTFGEFDSYVNNYKYVVRLDNINYVTQINILF
jgi:hypothetical protein